MPIPNPNNYDSKDEYVEACMSAIGDEYDDKDQALAICFDKWKSRSEEKTLRGEDIERRYFPVRISELRVISEKGKPPILEGYAAVFNKLSENLGGFREKISPGAFKKAIRTSDTRMLFNHDQNYVLGRKGAGTLTLKEDDRGLLVRANPPLWANWIIESIDRGDISQMSFGFMTERDEWDHKENIRTLLEVSELVDVSPVTFPAYPDTTIALRSLEKSKEKSTTDDVPKQSGVDDEKDSVPKQSVDRLDMRLKLRLKEKNK